MTLRTARGVRASADVTIEDVAVLDTLGVGVDTTGGRLSARRVALRRIGLAAVRLESDAEIDELEIDRHGGPARRRAR